jgi:hypothetical protein
LFQIETFAVRQKGEENRMDDLISRQATVKAIEQHKTAALEGHIWDERIEHGYAAAHRHLVDIIEQLPSTQPILTCDGCRYDGYYKHMRCRNCIRKERDLYEPE